MKEKDPKTTPKTLMPSIEVQKLDGSENLKTLKEIKQHTYKVKPQGLPNLTKKKNDEKFERQLKYAQ
jgi:hypothetical protein